MEGLAEGKWKAKSKQGHRRNAASGGGRGLGGAAMGIASRELPTPGCSPMYNGADPVPSPGTDKGLCWGNPCSFISESRLPWPRGWHIAQTEETAGWREAWMLSVALHHGEPTPLTPPALQPSPWGCLHCSKQAGRRGTGPSPMFWKPCQFGQIYQPLAPCPCPVQHPWLSDVEHGVREELPFFCPKVLVDACRCWGAMWP